MKTQNNCKRKQREYKKRPEVKLECDRKKMKRSVKNSKAEENEKVREDCKREGSIQFAANILNLQGKSL